MFIILVSLMMTLLSEKVLISDRCISGLMSNLIKKSWTDSNLAWPIMQIDNVDIFSFLSVISLIRAAFLIRILFTFLKNLAFIYFILNWKSRWWQWWKVAYNMTRLFPEHSTLGLVKSICFWNIVCTIFVWHIKMLLSPNL